jgi:hypothetical protein
MDEICKQNKNWASFYIFGYLLEPNVKIWWFFYKKIIFKLWHLKTTLVVDGSLFKDMKMILNILEYFLIVHSLWLHILFFKIMFTFCYVYVVEFVNSNTSLVPQTFCINKRIIGYNNSHIFLMTIDASIQCFFFGCKISSNEMWWWWVGLGFRV